ncbi:FkbM family methyltransferase [Agrobacterium salinitolerans]|uniref:FkbM family methyltransferase n=1 Tax=Agrobacterium salinitolerans TaxID=1183413 RepID=A0A4Z1QPH2_9HYPH|nr:FkbM family methyltransferase [Agrobacterium salinitolerans]UYZ09252.1 FkbM family methyltransferase [Agrobacterium salinitolerans]
MRPSDLRKIAPNWASLWRNVNLIRNFDSGWYVENYPDAAGHRLSPLMHFIRYGIEEKRRPAAWFDTELYVPDPIIFVDDVPVNGVSNSYVGEIDEAYLGSLKKCEKLWLFFNVATTEVLSGGMLSINRFVDIAIESAIDRQNTVVAVSGVPVSREAVKYKLFEERLPMVHFDWITEYTNPVAVKLFVPEVFATEFFTNALEQDHYRRWLKSRPDLEIIILNQNNELMPHPQHINPLLNQITKFSKIATAHPRYCTQSLALKSGLPVKQLTPLLPVMEFRRSVDRQRIFMLSPDVFTDPLTGITSEDIIVELKKILPDFEFVIVNGLTLAEYLELASKAMFSLTFGEGMDGYFIEPILSGGVSFAVYNEVFFPEYFADAPTVRKDWRSLLSLIEDVADGYASNPDLYNNISNELRELIGKTYSREITKNNFNDLIDGMVDHPAGPRTRQVELFDNIRSYLESEKGFRFHGSPGKKVVVTPDGLLVEHLGAEFYSVLYEIYERRDYDLDLDDGKEYYLIDIGANVGMASLYLRNRYPNIKRIFAFEPLHKVAEIAKRNVLANSHHVPIVIKEIGLSDNYHKATLEYYEDWTTAFSTDDQTLDSFLKNSEQGARSEAKFAEVEVVPASVEIREIIAAASDLRLAMKCDTQGSEFAIFRSLDAEGLLQHFDAIVVESHFKSPDELIGILERNGFELVVRCDHEKNVVYTIKASRKQVRD